jgi:hypothetical protein
MKKINKIIIIIAIILIIAIIIFSVILINKNSNPGKQISNNSNNTDTSNNSFFKNDSVIYFQKTFVVSESGVASDGEYKVITCKTDGTDSKEIWNKTLYNIQYSNGYIYGLSDSAVYKIKEDGSSAEKITNGNDYVNWFIVYDNYVFYGKDNYDASDDIFEKLVRINVDGTNDIIIDERSVSKCIVDKDGVFVEFYTAGSGKEIEKMDFNGQNRVIFSNAKASKVMYKFLDYIYYTNINDNNCFYRIKIDGSDNVKLTTDSFTYSNITFNPNNGWQYGVIDNYFYYINSQDNNRPYRVKLDGTGREKLSDDNLKILYIKGNNIYIHKYGDIELLVTDKNFKNIHTVIDKGYESFCIR